MRREQFGADRWRTLAGFRDVEFSSTLDALFDDPALVALRGAALPNQRESDVELVECIDYMAYWQRSYLWEHTPGNRFKKAKRDWQVGVLATCVGFCLGEALSRSKALAEANRDYMAKNLALAQSGADSLLEPRSDFAAHGAHGARVLEAAVKRANVKVKNPLELMIQLAAGWRVGVETMRGLPGVPPDFLT